MSDSTSWVRYSNRYTCQYERGRQPKGSGESLSLAYARLVRSAKAVSYTHLGMTQEQLAERIWVTKAAISNYELSERNPSPETIIKIAGVFGVTTDLSLIHICPAVYLICSVIKQIFNLCTAVSLVQVEIRHCCGKACIGNIGNDAGCSIPYILSVGNSVGVFVQLAVYILVECGFVRKVLICLLYTSDTARKQIVTQTLTTERKFLSMECSLRKSRS